MPISVNGANGITFADGSIQNTGASGFGFKNRLINGDMKIAQRGTSFSAPNPGYTTDRWNYICWNGNTTVTQSQVAPTGFTYSLLQTVSSGGSVSSSNWQGVGQVIEAFNVGDLGWGTANAQTVTLSFWVRSSVTGIYNVSLSNINGVQNLSGTTTYHYITTYTINAANTWEYKTVTIAGPTSGSWNTTGNGNGISVWFDLGSGTNYNSSSPNTWEYATTFRTSSATSQVSGVTGSTWYLTGVQLEKGSTATAYDLRSHGHELMLCQRYYERMEAQTQFWVPNTSYLSHAINLWQFRVVKRSSPTLSPISGASITMDRYGIGPPTVTASSIDSATQYSARAYVNFNTNYTCGEGITLQTTYWQASAEF